MGIYTIVTDGYTTMDVWDRCANKDVFKQYCRQCDVDCTSEYPIDLQTPVEELEKIRDLACRAVKAVGIDNGPAHVEIMLTKDGPKMVELGARMGGDCITTHLVPLSTGIDMIKATMDICLGQAPDITPKFQKGSAIRFFDVAPGTITAIEGMEGVKNIPGVKKVSFTKQVGDTVGEIGASGDRAGFVIAQEDTVTQAITACEQASQTIAVILE